MNLGLLTHAYYLFDPSPSTISVFFWIFTGFFILTIGGSIACTKIVAQWPEKTRGLAKKLFKNEPKTFLWLGIIGVLIEFFRYENVPYLSMRVITYTVALLILIFIGKALYKGFKIYPEEYKKLLTEKEINKYLPKKRI